MRNLPDVVDVKPNLLHPRSTGSSSSAFPLRSVVGSVEIRLLTTTTTTTINLRQLSAWEAHYSNLDTVRPPSPSWWTITHVHFPRTYSTQLPFQSSLLILFSRSQTSSSATVYRMSCGLYFWSFVGITLYSTQRFHKVRRLISFVHAYWLHL